MLVVGVGQCAWGTLAVIDRFPQIGTGNPQGAPEVTGCKP
jgi:hypothetical protein